MDVTSEEYLGDGLYASFDGLQIWLRTPREGGDHRVALEPDVFARLVDYQRRVVEQLTSAKCGVKMDGTDGWA